ncbi:hypothetical protein ACA910_020143 [Epithemia clementina (nom. ined.)]
MLSPFCSSSITCHRPCDKNSIIRRHFRLLDEHEKDNVPSSTPTYQPYAWFRNLWKLHKHKSPTVEDPLTEQRETYEYDFWLWVSKELRWWLFRTQSEEGSFSILPYVEDGDAFDGKAKLVVKLDCGLEGKGEGDDGTSISSASPQDFWNVAGFLGASQSVGAAAAAEGMLKQLTRHMERFTPSVAEISSFLQLANEVVVVANYTDEKSLQCRGGSRFDQLLVNATRDYAARFLSITDGLLSQGYVDGDPLAGKEKSILQYIRASRADLFKKRPHESETASEALFGPFESAVELNDWSPELEEMYKMAKITSTIYNKDDSAAVQELLAQGEAFVASGTTANVKWLVTDSEKPTGGPQKSTGKCERVRTITFRGFDASDDTVDRPGLLYTICSAKAETLQVGRNKRNKLLVHSNLFRLAEHLYHYVIKPHLDSPDAPGKIVLAGHSIGGALSTLLLIWTVLDKGAAFATRRIQKVYSFGAPPVVTVISNEDAKILKQQQRQQRKRLHSKKNDIQVTGDADDMNAKYDCDVLHCLGLPSTIVHGYIQPWDPITRLFSSIDPVYPLIGEIDMENYGDDGMVLWPRGPPRALRPVTSAILEAWGEPGWPQFRDDFRKNWNQTYNSVGVQHIYMPEPKRYLLDRFMIAGVVDIAVPPVQTIVRLSSRDLYPALTKAFPLDVFEISYVPQAIRSFVHHFYPAYYASLVDYVRRLRKEKQKQPYKHHQQIIRAVHRPERRLGRKTNVKTVVQSD